MSVFFDRKYLRGRYFDASLMGYRWAARSILWQRILGFNRSARFPVSPFMGIDAPEHVFFDPDDLQNFQHWGCYYANTRGGRIFIGKGTWIAPNVGIITTNHKLTDLEEHDPPKDVRIGRNCWIGISAVVLPGVALGDHTVVAAGAVVTKSFPDGWCVIGGNPASVLKPIEQEPVIR